MYGKLQADFNKALRAKDELTKMVIRNIKVSIERKQQEKVLAEKPDNPMESKSTTPSDEMVTGAIRKEIKELSNAVKELPAGCKLVVEYKEQIEVCKKFLPKTDSDKKAIAEAVDKAIGELSDTNIKTRDIKIGMVVGRVMRNNKDFPGSVVKSMVVEKVGVS